MPDVTEGRNSKFHTVGTHVHVSMQPSSLNFTQNGRLIGDATFTATIIKHNKRSYNIYLGYCMLKFYMHNSSICVNQPNHPLPVIIVLFIICDRG